jgi:phosphohistidine phosphatase
MSSRKNMKLYVMRHGEYAVDDENKHGALSAKGEADIKALVAFLKPLNLSITRIIHSGKVRAEQTARLISQAFESAEEPIMQVGLNPNDDIDPLIEEVNHAENDQLIVGHLPFLDRFTAQLITGDSNKSVVIFHPGTIVCLEQIYATQWATEWVISPKLISS